MIITPPMCMFCKHYDRSKPFMACAAFPAGIPDEIIKSQFDHRRPHSGDNGIQFEPADDGDPTPTAGSFGELKALMAKRGLDAGSLLAQLTGAIKGGPGSGNFGHAGRPGEVGGSASNGMATRPNARRAPEPEEKRIKRSSGNKAGDSVPKFATAADAEKWLSDRHSSIEWKLDGADIKAVQPALEAAHRILQDFPPLVFADLKRIGVGQLDDLAGKTSSAVTTTRVEGGRYRQAVVLDTDAVETEAASKELCRNLRESGWLHEWTQDAGALVSHELGHAIENFLLGKVNASSAVWYRLGKGDVPITASALYAEWRGENMLPSRWADSAAASRPAREKYFPEDWEPETGEYSKIDEQERFAEAVGWIYSAPDGTPFPNTYVRNVNGLLGWMRAQKFRNLRTPKSTFDPTRTDQAELFTYKSPSGASINALNRAMAEIGLVPRWDADYRYSNSRELRESYF